MQADRPGAQRAAERLPPRAVARVEDLLPASRPLRVLLFGKRKSHTRVTTHLARGFRSQGHRVRWLRPGRLARLLGPRRALDRLLRRSLAFRPDLVVVYKHDVEPALLDALPADVPRAVYYEDLPPDPAAPGERLLAVARRATILFTTAGGMVPIFASLGVPRVAYLRGGCDPRDHGPGRTRRAYRSDVAFIGRAEGDERLALLDAVRGRARLALYGRGWSRALGVRPVRSHVHPRRYRDVCASSRIVLGIDARVDVPLYFSNRTWLTLGCAGFLLTRYVPGLEEFFVNHEHLVWFSDKQECLELIDHYLPRGDARRRIAAAGHAYVHAYHTFRHAAAELVGVSFGKPWHRGQDAGGAGRSPGQPLVRERGPDA